MPNDENEVISNSSLQRPERWRLALILLVACVLILANLGDHSLWQDEAQTALISRTVLTHGIPMGYDGTNYFSQEQGAEYDEQYRWRWHTWLPFYLLAAFFSLLGESTFVARLPFALAGIATIAATYFLARELWRDKYSADAAAWVLTLSIPALLLTRQCRWYSLAALFTVLSLIGYLRLMRGQRHAGVLLLTGSLLLFHTHFLYLACLLATLGVHAVLWHRDKLGSLVKWMLAIVVLCVPWLIWFLGMKYDAAFGRSLLEVGDAPKLLRMFTANIGRHIFHPALFVVPPVIAAIQLYRRRLHECFSVELWRPSSCLLLLVVATLGALCLVAPGAYFRYLAPLLPIAALLIGRLVQAVARFHWAAGIVLLALVVTRAPLADYYYELTHDFKGPIDGIVEHLHEHGDQGDVVLTTYGDMPIKFYTDMRVFGGLTGEDLEGASEADWLIIRRHHVAPSKSRKVYDFIRNTIDLSEYRRTTIDYPDTAFNNRPGPSVHKFRTAVGQKRVVIYRRIASATR